LWMGKAGGREKKDQQGDNYLIGKREETKGFVNSPKKKGVLKSERERKELLLLKRFVQESNGTTRSSTVQAKFTTKQKLLSSRAVGMVSEALPKEIKNLAIWGNISSPRKGSQKNMLRRRGVYKKKKLNVSKNKPKKAPTKAKKEVLACMRECGEVIRFKEAERKFRRKEDRRHLRDKKKDDQIKDHHLYQRGT